MPKTKAPSHLKNHRAQPILPHRVLKPVADLLRQFAELADGLERQLDDGRWGEAAEALERAAGCLDTKHQPQREA